MQPEGMYFARAQELGINWFRVSRRISWRLLQPKENGPIEWQALEVLEQELRAMKSAGMTPLLVVKDSPVWATNNTVREDGRPTSCGPLLDDKFDDFAEFLRLLVQHFSQPEFNVHNWELGNEPDVDPDLVPPNYPFGCWGNIEDRFYGGRNYGDMLKVVTPVIKTQDPHARVWIGGLLLNSPQTRDPNHGKPELFLKGILEAGAGEYFDVLPYHWYPPYFNEVRDYDLTVGLWAQWGGGTLGKARFLREMMAEYGIEKTLVLNETGLLCPPTVNLNEESQSYFRLNRVGLLAKYCNSPDEQFYEAQANYLVRSFVRGVSGGVKGMMWYTLEGPGWWNTGMLDENGNPFPAYYAYQHLNKVLDNTRFSGQVEYGPGIEAYSFHRGVQEVHVLWAIEDTELIVSMPMEKFVAAFGRQGNEIIPAQGEDSYLLSVRFSPIYIVLTH
jgi:hypothetical protein